MTPLSPRHRAWTDFGIVVGVALVCGWAAASFELIERLFVWTRRFEHFQLDEVGVGVLILAIGMLWFALRRYQDALREAQRHNDAQAQLAESLVEQRRLAQRYVLMQEAERKALARELHDELGQYLNAIKIEAVALRNTRAMAVAPGAHDSEATGEVTRSAAAAIIANADHVYGTVGALIRRLRPVGLDELGLAAALEHLVDGARARAPRTRFTLAITGDVDDLGEAAELALYRLVQEGLTNCAKHAAAPAMSIEILRAPEPGGERIIVTLTDDGVGADWSRQRDGLGLVGMRERIEALGGQLAVSTAPGRGFRVVASFPIAPAGTHA